jgi:hypothetical protein
MSNVKAGDLAVVVRPRLPVNKDRIVTVVKWLPINSLLPNGGRCLEESWLCNGFGLITRQSDGSTSSPRDWGLFADESLRPIHDPGEDAADEMLRPLPVQDPEFAHG